MTRRRLLASLSAAVTLRAALAPAQLSRYMHRHPRGKSAAPQPFVFIGTEKGIFRSRFDFSSGQLIPVVPAADTPMAAFLALNLTGNRHILYATREGHTADTSAIESFSIDPATGVLRRIGSAPAGAAGPCYVSVDSTGRTAFAADYAGGMLATYLVRPDGTLSDPVERIDFHTFGHNGPDASRQDGPHPHSATLSPDDRFLIVNDLGRDLIAIFPIHQETARLGTPQITQVRAAGAGPRHVAFHPNGRWLYGINELASTIDQYLFNTAHGLNGADPTAYLTTTGRSISTLGPTFHGPNTAAELTISPNGFFLYASNRGEDSLATFRIDPVTGALTYVETVSTGGKGPRFFTLDPTGAWLLCGNQRSGSVTVFHRDPATGTLLGPTQTLPVDSPMYILFA